jgi:ribokinase
MTAGLVVFGDIGIDIVANVSSLSRSGGDSRVRSLSFYPGGSAANCAAVAAYLGLSTWFLGALGNDRWGEELRSDLEKWNVRTEGLRTLTGKSSATIALIDHMGERTFYSYRGVSSDPGYGPPAQASLEDATHLHLSSYSFQDPRSKETALQLLSLAKQKSKTVSLDLSYIFCRDYEALGIDILSEIDILFPNRLEAEMLVGKSDPKAMALSLQSMGPRTIALKLGSGGCLLLDSSTSVYVEGFQVRSMGNTIGAGDAFAGGFLAMVARGLDAPSAAKVANLCASVVITGQGGHSNAPSLQSIASTLKELGEIGLYWRLCQISPIDLAD